MLEKLKNKMETAHKKSAELYESFKVSKGTQAKRIEICNSCEHLFKPTNTCKKCGCFMDVKTWLAPASCPIGKWSASAVDPKDKIATSQDS